MPEKQKIYDLIWPEITDWPIWKMHKNRAAFVKEVEEITLRRIMTKKPSRVTDIIAKTIYSEKIRCKNEPWKVDPPNEYQFWSRLQKKLQAQSVDKPEEEARIANEEILKQIIHRYAEEIVGTFKKKTFLFARKFLTFLFTKLLNTAAERNLKRIWGGKRRLYDKMIVQGEVEKLRSLITKGTVVLTPTHSSNLDSILIGYAMDTIVGLPAFIYGAGLNLYNFGPAAYYMNRLGAYRVDRRKKNRIYLETLKMVSQLSVEHGTNNLFFPGGTRSRSGEIEQKLKMGLLGTTIDAQMETLKKGKDNKVFVVPIVLGYHFVLEAQHLIEQHLRKIGKEQYFVTKDASYSFRRIIKFIWQLFSTSNEIYLSIGQPMDVFGNHVNAEGESFDKYGNKLELKDYFRQGDGLTTDYQRNSQYTKSLADSIALQFKRDNIVLSSKLLAFTAFELLQREYKSLDLFALLRLPEEDVVFEKEKLLQTIAKVRDTILELEAAGEIKVSSVIRGSAEDIFNDGIEKLGSFHVKRPLMVNKKGQIISQSLKILYFYHNGLEGYGISV